MVDRFSVVLVNLDPPVGRIYPSRVPCQFQGRDGQVVLDQIRTVDKSRLVKHLGTLSDSAASDVLETIGAMFAP